MKRCITFGLLVLVFCGMCFGAGWQRTYGGFQDDQAYCVKVTHDRGFVIVGNTYSWGPGAPSNPNLYIIRTNSNGDTLWTRVIGGTDADYGYSLVETSDNGFAVVGYTKSFGAGGYDVYLVRFNSSGDTLWSKTYGGYSDDFGYSIAQTADGGFIVVGSTRSMGFGGNDVYLLRINARGDTLWTRTFGSNTEDFGYSVRFTSDNEFIVTGSTQFRTRGRDDVYILKISASGDTVWTKTYGGSGVDYGYSVAQALDGGYIIAGYTESFGGTDRKGYVIKTNGRGDTLWTRIYGGPDDDWFQAVAVTPDSGYVFVGRTFNVTAGNYDVYLVRTDGRGNLLWENTFGGSGHDFGFSVDNTYDGAYIIAGWTRSFGFGGWNVYLIKTRLVGYAVYELHPGWNLLSLPFNVVVPVEDIFPYSIPPAYVYNPSTKRYDSISSVSFGYGFWILNYGDTTFSILDTLAIGEISGTLQPGWNLISGPSFAVPASDLTSLAGVIPPVYGYDGRVYYRTDFLYPGKGYWVLSISSVPYRLPR